MLEYQAIVERKYSKVMFACPECRKNHRWNACPAKFPTFGEVKLTDSAKSKEEGLLARLRGPRQKHHTLFNRKRLYELELLKEMNEDSFYGRIGKRLMKIRDHIQSNRNLFEVDLAHDWPIYLPDHNLSKMRELVNEKKVVKRFTRLSVFSKH